MSLPSWHPKSPHPWLSLGAPSPADAHDARACGAHHEVTAAGGSSIIEFAGAASRRQKPAPTPHGTRPRFAAIHQLISSFASVPATPQGRASRDPRGAAKEGRRLVPASLLKGFAFTASPSSGGPRPRPQKGPAALPDLKSLRLKPPTPQELEARTSGSPTCRRVRGGFSVPPLLAGRRRMSQAWTLEV